MTAATSRWLERLRAAVVALADSAAPLAVGAPAVGWVWGATVLASWATLGRDQGIFQYIAWAVSQGEVVYRDVRDVNGPVITMIHWAFLALGGAEEHRFRVLDLAVTGGSFAVAGACIPSFVEGRRGPHTTSRLLWALASWAALSAQYVVYGFWDTAQRESFLDWFVLVSVALQATRSADGAPRDRRTIAALGVSGALSFLTWLGKPTYAVFTVAQVLALALGAPSDVRGAGEHRRRFFSLEHLSPRLRRLGTFFAGGFVGLVVPVLFIAWRGDLGRWAQITFVDVPAMYRFIWPRPASVILSIPGYDQTALRALVTTTLLLTAILFGRLPRRTIPVAIMPLMGLLSVVVQAKGFPYHFHPVTLGTTFGWLVLIEAVWQSRSPIVRFVALVGAGGVGAHAAVLAANAPYPEAPEVGARDKASLESAERLDAFTRVDFFPRALRDAAEYVAAHTRPTDRVQCYGMDAYVLFLAGRRSATPYIHAYDLNVDAALHGSFDPEGIRPSDEERERIRAMREAHAADLLSRLQRDPPAAFVFVDRSPLMSSPDAEADFSSQSPDAGAWLRSHFHQTAEFEGIHVWLPDKATGGPL